VKVKRDHVEVRARSGFFVTNATADPENSRNNDLASALKSPLDTHRFPASALGYPRAGQDSWQEARELRHAYGGRRFSD